MLAPYGTTPARPLTSDLDASAAGREVLNLRWSQLDLRAGAVRLEAEDTKTDEPRVVYLTDRVLAALAEQPRLLHADYCS